MNTIDSPGRTATVAAARKDGARRRAWARLTKISICASLLSIPAAAQLVRREIPIVHKLDTKSWQRRLQAAEQAARAADWKEAKKLTTVVETEVIRSAVSGKGLTNLLAMASMIHGLAEAGLGHDREAAWDFGVAQALVPGYRRLDLSPYPTVAARLEPGRYAANGADFPSANWQRDSIVAPRRLAGPSPQFPKSKSVACMPGSTAVWAIIGKDGRPRHPELEPGSDPLFAFVAWQALRDWTFTPATMNGEPTEVGYNLTVNFRLPACPPDIP